MSKLNYVIKRVLQMIPVVLISAVLIFVMIRMIPGDPARIMVGERALPEVYEAYREKMGLNDSYFTQFMRFFKSMLTFDLGESVHYRLPVTELIARRFPVTLWLTLTSTLLTILLSLPLGYLAGMRQNKLADQGIRTFALLGLSIPSFWIALVLLMVFGVRLHWFPVSGWGETTMDHIRSLVLPSLTQAIAASAVVVRNTRNNVVDVKTQDYVDFARAKGLTRLRVSMAHIIRNALIPTVTLLSMRIAYMFGGTVIIESVFDMPGMGELLVSSVSRRDYAVVQGVVIVFVLIVLVVNLITDIIYSIIDPRISLE